MHLFFVTLRTYGLALFSNNTISSALVLLATWVEPWMGLCGFAGALLANGVAYWLQAQEETWRSGLFGISGLFIGLAVAVYAPVSPRSIVLGAIGVLFGAVLTMALARFFLRSDLPVLSWPFSLVIWLLLLALGNSAGPHRDPVLLEGVSTWLASAVPYEGLRAIRLFGSVVFQNHFLSGLLILAAVAVQSRISLFYAIWGAAVGTAAHWMITGAVQGLIGLNYILVAIAIGGFFLIHGRYTFLYATAAVLATVVVVVGTEHLLNQLHPPLPVLAFPFNAVATLFLLPIKLSPSHVASRIHSVPLAVIQSPETNLRWARQGRSGFRQKTLLTLPFVGEWAVLQGNHGEWTHKERGTYAWDFVVRDARGHQAPGEGRSVEEFYAFGLPVVAPAPGTVVGMRGSVPDNAPQESTLELGGWGNYVVIAHAEREYSLIAHFAQGGVTIQPGQFVERGALLGRCGNSGRSPVPHIHYQLQDSAEVDGQTLPAHFAELVRNSDVVLDTVPEMDDRLVTVAWDEGDSFTLLGREGERWEYEVAYGWLRFREELFFTTDGLGYPCVAGANNRLWHLIDRPSFVELRPDIKTSPSRLSPSVWTEAVGDGLMIPKKLAPGRRWMGGALDGDHGEWLLESNGCTFTISPERTISRIAVRGKRARRMTLVRRDRILR